MAAMISIDPQYLERVGEHRTSLRCVALLDGSGFDFADGIDHGNANSVLYGAKWVEEFAFDHNIGMQTGCEAIESNQGSAANGFGNIVKYLTHT